MKFTRKFLELYSAHPLMELINSLKDHIKRRDNSFKEVATRRKELIQKHQAEIRKHQEEIEILKNTILLAERRERDAWREVDMLKKENAMLRSKGIND